MTDEKPKFEIISKADNVVGKKGVEVLISRQKIIQPDKSESEHIVVKKIRRAEDGTQQGVVRQLFLPVDLVEDITKAILSLKKK